MLESLQHPHVTLCINKRPGPSQERGVAIGKAVSVEYRRFHAEHLVQLWRGRGVLHVDFLFREDIRSSTKGCQRALMEARQNQLFLARIGIDVTHSKDAR